MKIMGVCGKSGSGKSTYSRKLSRENGSLLIDVDKIVHQLLELDRTRDNVVALAKSDSFVKNGKIDRKSLGSILFSDSALLDAYNKMIYKEIEFVIDRMLTAAEGGNINVVIDWALLPLSKYHGMCSEKHLIKKPEQSRQKSVMSRDGVTEDYFKNRDKHALEYNESEFDKVIEIEFTKKGFFAGSFDPFTLGHLDVVERASKDFDQIVVGVAIHPQKLRRFDKDSMRFAINQATNQGNIKNADCVVYSGFTGEKALEMDCYTLVRGIRSEADKIYEQQIADYNKQHFGLDTTYYISPEHLKNVSSSHVKEMMKRNESVKDLVPKSVHDLIY